MAVKVIHLINEQNKLWIVFVKQPIIRWLLGGLLSQDTLIKYNSDVIIIPHSHLCRLKFYELKLFDLTLFGSLKPHFFSMRGGLGFFAKESLASNDIRRRDV